jgi:hypothetical protein
MNHGERNGPPTPCHSRSDQRVARARRCGKARLCLGLEKWVKKKLGLDIDDAGFIEMGGMRLARDSKAARAAGWNDIADMLDKFEDMTSEEQLEAWTKQAP